MGLINSIISFLASDVFAVYLVGFVGFAVTINQLKRNFKLRKKADTFEELAKEIREASDLSRTIINRTDSMITSLASTADEMAFDAAGKSNQEIDAEVDRRIAALTQLQQLFEAYKGEVDAHTIKILQIIKNIEKSTIVKNKTQKAARYLYYEVNEQQGLMKAGNAILETLNVVPLIGKDPNVSPETFKAIKELLINISGKNYTIGGYLDDLEIILHNDLVKKVYGEAKNETLPQKHLSPEGIVDTRVQTPLL